MNDFLLGELVELYDETAGSAAMRMFSSIFLPDRHAIRSGVYRICHVSRSEDSAVDAILLDIGSVELEPPSGAGRERIHAVTDG